MTGNGAFEDRMDAETTIFMRVARVTLPVRPDPQAEADLVRRLAETVRLSDAAAAPSTESGRVLHQPIFRSRRALIARVAVAVALVPAALAGLAFAGVTLPDATRSAFESVGVDLPNQPASDEGEKGSTADDADQQQSPADRPGSAASEQQQKQKAPGQAKAKAKGDQAGADRPGRRVQRHGEGPIPGPAAPPEGKALGHSKGTGNPHGDPSSGKAKPPGQAGQGAEGPAGGKSK